MLLPKVFLFKELFLSLKINPLILNCSEQLTTTTPTMSKYSLLFLIVTAAFITSDADSNTVTHSVISGNSDVKASTLTDSAVDSSKVHSSTITSTRVARNSNVMASTTVNSDVIRANIIGSTLENCRIVDRTIRGQALKNVRD